MGIQGSRSVSAVYDMDINPGLLLRGYPRLRYAGLITTVFHGGNRTVSNNWYWEDVSDIGGAEKAIAGGFWAALFVAGVTTLVVVLSLAGVRLFGIGVSALLDAVIFAAIAVGIKRKSRFAAVAGLALFVLERILMFRSTGVASIFLGIVLALFFLNAVRGTFAYRRLKAGAQAQPPISVA
jgi:hypothetical protein